MKALAWLERGRAQTTLAPAPEFDEADALSALEALGGAAVDATAHPVDGLAFEDEALQEVAEQTTYGEVLLEDLVRRQLRLALGVSAAFLVLLFGLPLMNLVFPELVAIQVLGLPMSWLALAVLIYPLLWTLGAYFVSSSRKN